MAKFVFSLEGVLRQRQQIEDEKQRNLALKQTQLVELQNLLRQMQLEIETANNDVRANRLIGMLNMQFLAAHRRFLAGMQRQAISAMQKLSLAQRAVDEARAELAEAAKGRKAIEKLREKAFERWRAEQDRRELAAADEAGMQLAYEHLAQGYEGKP
jgi:flagellar FliJ protein